MSWRLYCPRACNKTYRAPNANAVPERWIRSVRQECPDHVLVLGEAHLGRVLREYVAYFQARNPRSPTPSGD